MMTDDVTIGVFAGTHVLADLDDIDPGLLDDPGFLREALRNAVTGAGATVRDILVHRFQPRGVTVLAMLAESHASIHTYPEVGAMFVDVFTCGDRADPEEAVRRLASSLNTCSVATSSITRGHPTRKTRT